MSYAENPELLTLVNKTADRLSSILGLFKPVRKFKGAKQLVVLMPDTIEGLETICGVPVVYVKGLDGIYLGHKLA